MQLKKIMLAIEIILVLLIVGLITEDGNVAMYASIVTGLLEICPRGERKEVR